MRRLRADVVVKETEYIYVFIIYVIHSSQQYIKPAFCHNGVSLHIISKLGRGSFCKFQLSPTRMTLPDLTDPPAISTSEIYTRALSLILAA